MSYKVNKIYLILLALLFIPVSSCRPSTAKSYPEISFPDEYVEGQDFNPTAYSWCGTPNVAAVTEDGIYFKAGIFLYFADKTTLKARPLCYKLTCAHSSASEEQVGKCNAFCPTPIGKDFVGVFRDKVYYSGFDTETGRYELYSADLDGSNRKVFIADISSIVMNSMRIHRGVMYYPEGMIDLDGKEYYLHFWASVRPFAVELYSIEDLLNGKLKSHRLLYVMDMNDLSPGFRYTVK